MKLTVKLDFGCGREIKVGTFSEIGRDTAFEFAGEFLSSGLSKRRRAQQGRSSEELLVPDGREGALVACAVL
jgi:hypothetical protein